MLENLDRFFRRAKEQKSPLKLFDDAQLESMLGRIEGASPDERHLLQVTFYEKLLKCDLLLPVPTGTDTRRGIPILALENSHGERGMPVFTSEKTVLLWADDGIDYVALPFSALCRYAVEAGVDFMVINVSGPYGCEISSYDFHYLADGMLPPPPAELCEQHGKSPGEVVIPKNTPMRLGHCDGLAPGLMERLNHVFSTHAALISRVYLFNIAFNEGPLQPALGIRIAEDTDAHWETNVWPDLQAVLHEMLERRSVINVFLLNQAGSLEHHVRELTAPIFER
jgi:hypothetical protein